MEKEENEFAADVLFLGDGFSIKANAGPITARTIIELATKYTNGMKTVRSKINA